MRRDSRPTSHQRGYDSAWQKARAAFLRLKPRCEMCGGKAEHVHHKIPHKGNPAIFWNRSQWQPLCESCHNRFAQQVEAHGYHSRIGSDGLPTDPNHPFNHVPPGVKKSHAFRSRPAPSLSSELVAAATTSPEGR